MSKTKLRNATWSIHQLVEQMNIQAYATRADMRVMLTRCVKDLHALGFKVGHVHGIKERHVLALVEHWKVQGKNPATIKNYMSKLRKMAHHLGNPTMISPDNSAYQINQRNYAPTHNKAIERTDFHCQDPYTRLSLEGQALFGFRREESIKFTLNKALAENQLVIHPGWTKGGIGRTLIIRTEDQRAWIERVRQLVKPGSSLIPPGRTYKQHLGTYQSQVSAIGLSKCHGLRHAYAQKRYIDLTRYFDEAGKGLIPPVMGGDSPRTLTGKALEIDRKARHIISRELGHSRLNITKIYLG